jgi:hypothetical protein
MKSRAHTIPVILCAILCFMVFPTQVFAQDTICLRGGDVIRGKVINLSESEIRFRKESLPDGPDFVLKPGELSRIVFANGTVKLFEVEQPSAVEHKPEDKNMLIELRGSRYYYQGLPLNERSLASVIRKGESREAINLMADAIRWRKSGTALLAVSIPLLSISLPTFSLATLLNEISARDEVVNKTYMAAGGFFFSGAALMVGAILNKSKASDARQKAVMEFNAGRKK